jgi:DNA excision repair protein ERCC-8
MNNNEKGDGRRQTECLRDQAATMAEAISSSIPGISLYSLIEQRCEGRLSALEFRNRLTRQRAPKALSRLITIASTERSVTSLQIHPHESRFLVTGSTAGKCTIYNLSRYGSQPNRSREGARMHHPIAQTSPVASHVLPGAAATDTDSAHTSLGPVTSTRWYPADSGAFLSSHLTGSLLLWDTNALQPVLTVQPFASEMQPCRDPLAPTPTRPAALTTMETSSRNPQLVAAASTDVAAWRLVDLRTGAASHRCTGHRGAGVTALAWSPVSAHVVASGGSDGTVRLWDIRKAGCHAWLGSPLDADANAPPAEDALIRKSFAPDYSHWNQRGAGNAVSRGRRRAATAQDFRRRPLAHAPNDYSEVKTSVQSHRGAVTALAFDPVGAHHLVSYGSVDHQVRLWDLTQDGGRLVPRHYDLAPRRSTSHQIPTRLVWPDRGSLWAAQGLHLHQFGWEGGAAQQRLVGHLKRIQALDVCPDTGNLFTGGADGLVLVWSSETKARGVVDRKRKLRVDRDNW